MEDFLVRELIKRGVRPYNAQEAARLAVNDKRGGDITMKAARAAERLQPGFKWTR